MKYSTALLLAWEWSWVVYKNEAKADAEYLLSLSPNIASRDYIIEQLAKNNRDIPEQGLELEQFHKEWRSFRGAQGDPVQAGEFLPKLHYNKDDE